MKESLKKTSILWIGFFNARGGLSSSALANILKQSAELGYKTSLITASAEKNQWTKYKQFRTISIPLREFPLLLPALFDIFLFFSLPLLSVILRVDVIITESYLPILSTFEQLLISKFTKTKLVLDIRTTPVESSYEGLRGSLMKFWFSASVLIAKKKFDGITIITPMMKEEICNNFAMDSERVGVWTSGVSETLFNPEHYVADRSRFREKLGLNGKFVILYHGVFSHTRGLMETVDAMKILAPKYPDIIFFLLGTGPLAPKLEESAQDMVIQKNVIVAKPVGHSAVPRFINMCDVGIIPLPDHPYWRFQSPLKLLEYLAMKKPVILTDIPAHRTIVEEAKCGVYISSVKPTQIAEAIEYAYRNRQNLEEWGEIGIKIVRKRYTWSKVAEDLENYLNSIDN